MTVLYSCRNPSFVKSPDPITTSGVSSLTSEIARFIRLGTKWTDPTCRSEMCAIVRVMEPAYREAPGSPVSFLHHHADVALLGEHREGGHLALPGAEERDRGVTHAHVPELDRLQPRRQGRPVPRPPGL